MAVNEEFKSLPSRGFIQSTPSQWASLLIGTIFSIIDLKVAFYQLPTAEEDIMKTAMTTPLWFFEFTRSSLGKQNAVQSFQPTLDHPCPDLPFLRAWLDDIIIASQDHTSIFDIFIGSLKSSAPMILRLPLRAFRHLCCVATVFAPATLRTRNFNKSQVYWS